MKNITKGLLLFTVGIAATLFFANGNRKKLIGSPLDNNEDTTVDENDIDAVVNKIEKEFRRTHTVA